MITEQEKQAELEKWIIEKHRQNQIEYYKNPPAYFIQGTGCASPRNIKLIPKQEIK